MAILRKVLRYAKRRYFGYYINIDGFTKKIEDMLSSQSSCLNKQGFIHGTDKASLIGDEELHLAHDYLRHYDYMFSQFRGEKFSLIEFGCAEGASLRTWEQYFPYAEIYGVDLDNNAKRHETERIHVVIGDATSKETRNTLQTLTGGSAFIILDDASHAWADQRISFELFWDIVSPGGFYVIEDLVCGSLGAYPAYPPKVQDSQPFCDYMHDRSKILRWAPDRYPEINSYHFDHLPAHVQKIERELDMCTFIPGAVIAKKKA